MAQEQEPDTKALAIIFDTAVREGALSPDTRRILDRPEIQEQITLASGTPLEKVAAENPFLVTVLCDDSGSLLVKWDEASRSMILATLDDPYSNAQAVIRGQNRLIDALLQDPNADRILICTQSLNGGVIDPYHPLKEAVRLSRENFSAGGLTPLYPRSRDVLAAVLAKTLEGTENYQDPRTATLIITDGEDNSGRSVEEVAKFVRDLMATGRHIVAGYGIASRAYGGRVDEKLFREAFTGMGIEPQWILTTESSSAKILEAMKRFTTAVRQATAAATPKQWAELRTKGFPMLGSGK